MDITQVKIFPVGEDKLKAFVSIVFDHCFMVNDIKVIQGKDGLFLSMPSRRKRTGEFKDVAHPLNNETRRGIEERVLGEYRRMVDDPTPRRPDRADEGDIGEPTQAASGPPADPAGDELATLNGHRKAPPGASNDDQTLEEVQEMHLRESFWTVS